MPTTAGRAATAATRGRVAAPVPERTWSGLVDRPRLLDRLEDGMDGGLVVLCAPAGYGKSTLARQLSGRRPAVRVADEGVAGVGAQEGLDEVLGRSPGSPPVVVACRPGSSLATQLGRVGGAAVVDEADLAFSADEAGRLIRQTTGRNPRDRHVAVLMQRTEGWPVALRVAALILSARPDWERATEELTGDQPHISAYIRHEVLDGLPPDIRSFLIQSSVLNRLDPVTWRVLGCGPSGSRALDFLLQRRLFVRPEGTGDRVSFAYLPIFQQALRRELRETDPAVERQLLSAAADWHARHREPEQAARYYIEAERWADLLSLLDRLGPDLYRDGRLDQVPRWLEQVPTASVEEQTTVGLRQAVAWTLLGGTESAEKVSQMVRRAGSSGPESILAQVLQGRVSASDRPLLVTDITDRTIRALRRAPRELPNPLGLAGRSDLLGMAIVDRGRSLWLLGRTAAARAALIEVADGAGYPASIRAEARGALAVAEAWRGDHRQARVLAASVLAPSTDLGPTVVAARTDAALALAHLCREEGDPEAAWTWVEAASRSAAAAPGGTAAALLAVESARLHLSAARFEQGLEGLRSYEVTAGPITAPRLDCALVAVRVRLELRSGNISAARRTLQSAMDPGSPSLVGPAVQVALAASDLQAAAACLDVGRGADEPALALEREMWEAVVEFDSGRRRQGLELMDRLLGVAEVAGRFQMLLDAGPALQRILTIMVRTGTNPYAAALLAAAGTVPTEAERLGLSSRELDIIRYLPTPLSSAQMAARLFISVNTLKTHLRTIYRKLGVAGRRDAITRAEELGLA